MSNISQGLLLSALGISVTFVALGALIVVIYVLQWIFPPKTRMAKSTSFAKNENNEEIAAAIGVAIALLDNKKKFGADLGQLLQRPPGGWKNASEDRTNLSKG